MSYVTVKRIDPLLQDRKHKHTHKQLENNLNHAFICMAPYEQVAGELVVYTGNIYLTSYRGGKVHIDINNLKTSSSTNSNFH